MWPHPSQRRPLRNVALLIAPLALGCLLSFILLSVYGAHVVADYLPLHTIIESFTIVIASLVFSVGWNAYRRELPSNILFIACAFLAVGVLDFSHMLSFTGMPDYVTASGPQKAITFWLAARTVAALTLFIVALAPWKPLSSASRRYWLLVPMLAGVAGLHWLFLLHADALPTFFIPGQGLQPVKLRIEYGLIALNLLTALLLRHLRGPTPFNAAGLLGVVCTMAMSEFFFTRFVDFTDTFNLLGHVYKVLSFLFLYFAIFVETIEHPFSQLHASQSQMQATLEAMPEAMLELSLDGHFHSCHAAKTGLLTGSPGELVGKSIRDFMPAAAAQTLLTTLRETDLSGHSHGHQVELRMPEGQRWFELSSARKAVRPGEDARFIVLMHDITERRKAEGELRQYKDHLEKTVEHRTEELRLARDAAEAANKAKSLFLANMSHELRTPMNAILGFSSMMSRDPYLPESQRETLGIINHSGEHLLSLINDVLEVAKIEAGRVRLEVGPYDLHRMVRDVTQLTSVRAHEKGLRLSLELAPEVPRFILGDEARLRQVLVNLVGNALKFTRQGGVNLRLHMRPGDDPRLLIEVEDSGIGISPEDQKRLFEPFVQLAEAGEQKGTGLGLVISRQFVRLMKGDIVVESEAGKGSLFRVEVPVALAGADEVRTPQPRGEVVGLAPGQPRYRVLIAEDQHENSLLLSRVMTGLGLEAKVAENGEQCVQLFEAWHPHLIWMDRRMPVMDGLEATRRIRQLPGGAEVKIVAVTASAFKEQEQELLDAGLDGFVRKPYRFEDLYDSLARQLGLEFLRGPEEGPCAAPGALTPEALEPLTPELRQELKAAIESLDSTRIDATVKRISTLAPELGRALSRLTDNFDYPTVLAALA